MIRIVSRASGLLYRRAAKPLLFRRPPDAVHSHMLRAASLVQRWPWLMALVRATWAYKDSPALEQEIAGLRFRNPVGLSAGFDKNFELPIMMRAVGCGFMEGGSVTFRPCAGNPRPWFHRLPRSKSLVVHAGLANDGVKVVVGRIQSYQPSRLRDFPLNISVAKTNSPQVCSEDEAVEDYIGSMRHIKQTNVGDMVTINISCPNTYGGEPFTKPAMLEHLLQEVDRLRLRVPVFVKMPNHLPWQEFDKLLAVIARHKIAGVTISNLAKRESGVQLSDPLPDDVRGGLSGKPTWERSNELIRRTYQKYGERFVIIGVGGIFSAEDAYIKIRLGASLVELITGMIFEGPQLIGQINQGLAELLVRDELRNISEAVGLDAKD